MSGERIGSLIGAVGGLVFILVNAGGLPVPLVVRCLGVAAFAFVVWYAVLRPRSGAARPPTRRAMRVYWICVGAMALAIPVGAIVINNVLDAPELTVCWVVLVVGAHFLPFAKTFDVLVFAPLAWTLIGIAVLGGALTLALDEQAAAWTAVLAGAALLAYVAFGARSASRPVGSEGR